MSKNGSDRPASVVLPKGVQGATVVLPCSADDFADFIKKLLGQPQSIARFVRCAFELDKDDLLNFHHLIIQRIAQQHDAQLIQFSAEVFFEDGLSRKVNSIEAFQSFHEVRPLCSVAVKFIWTILVPFAAKGYPEKQEISILFDTRRTIGTFVKIFDDFMDDEMFLMHGRGVVYFQIDHTERTWGDDIENMLRNHIETISKIENKLRLIVFNHTNKIAILCGILSGVGVMSAISISIKTLRTKKIEEYSNIVDISDAPIDKIVAKMDYIVNFLVYNELRGSEVVAVILAIIFMIAVTFCVLIFGKKVEPSFILLTSKTKELRDKTKRKMRNNWLGVLVTFGISVLASVVGTALYAFSSPSP